MAKLNPKASEFKLNAGSSEFVPGGETAAKKPAKKVAAAPGSVGKGGSFFDEPKKVLATAPPPKKAPKTGGGGFFDQADAGKKKLASAPPPSAGGVSQRPAKKDTAAPAATTDVAPTAAATPAPAATISLSATPTPVVAPVAVPATTAAAPSVVVPSPSPSPPPQSSPSTAAAAAAVEVMTASPPGGAPVTAPAPAVESKVALGEPSGDNEEFDDDEEIREARELEKKAAASAAVAPTVVPPAAGASTTVAAAARAKAKAHVGELKAHDEREHLNIVFIGHVDAGKSTISGQMLLLTNQVDERTMRKYETEAKEKNRESWYIAYIMDTNEEERAKGKTVEVGRAHFTTTNKRYTLLDCPGHKSFVPNMIGGTAQADVGVLVISARKDEFETGFDRGGQTREHAMLAKTLGIRRLVVMVNKMDDHTVEWDKGRYDEIEGKLSPFLKQWGYNLAKEVTYIPVSGQYGINLMTPVDPKVCPWYAGKPSFMQVLDGFEPLERDPDAPLRIPVITRYKDMGVLYVLGKVESGTVVANTELLLMPNNKRIQCTGVLVDEQDVQLAKTGENVILKVKGVEEEEVLDGFVVSSIESPVKRSKELECQLAVLPLLDHKPIITAGYECVLHIHSLAMECKITRLVSEHDKKTGKPSKKVPTFIKNGSIAIVRITTDETIAVENFKDYPQLGRFTLRDEGKTIGIGKIMRIKEFTK